MVAWTSRLPPRSSAIASVSPAAHSTASSHAAMLSATRVAPISLSSSCRRRSMEPPCATASSISVVRMRSAASAWAMAIASRRAPSRSCSTSREVHSCPETLPLPLPLLPFGFSGLSRPLRK